MPQSRESLGSGYHAAVRLRVKNLGGVAATAPWRQERVSRL